MIIFTKINDLKKYFGKGLTQDQQELYISFLRKFVNSQKIFDETIDFLIESERYFPTPQKIKEAYFQIKKTYWDKAKLGEQQSAKNHEEKFIYCKENPFKEIMRRARDNWRFGKKQEDGEIKKIPHNQTYFDRGMIDFIDDYSSPPADHEFVYSGVSFDDNKVFLLVNSRRREIVHIIKPIGINDQIWDIKKQKLDKIDLNRVLERAPF